MTPAGAERRALRPMWMLATGSVIGALAATSATSPVEPAASSSLLAIGCAAAVAALGFPRLWPLWLVAGLALAGGRGLQTEAPLLELERIAASEEGAALRVAVRLVTGWEPTRWGWRAAVRVRTASLGDRSLDLNGQWRLEVRGVDDPGSLPSPGSTVATLAALRGDAPRLFLVASSPQLLEVTSRPGGMAALRDGLARALLVAAGTRARRIRSAELAAALALGRRDLLPRQRRDGWRRSGLAHLLAVSGLHVGLVAGLLWLFLNVTGLHPRTARWLMMAALPAYALLAGASPSAVRAALMGVVYLAGRQLGRAVIPMASVLLVASVLLTVRPQLVAEAGFQLTVLVTAALVRWVPPLSTRLPGPRWLAGTIAVPVVAQLAAAPIVAHHFRTAIPGTVLANLAVPLVLAPTLASAVSATLLAPVWPAGAARLLDLVGFFEGLLWACGRPGRSMELVVPALPTVALVVLAAAGWLALQSGRRALRGAGAWVGILAILTGWWAVWPGPSAPRVELLPVADGLAATVWTPGGTMLLDAGRWTREAMELLVDGGVRRLSAVLVSHTDEDHMGGVALALGTLPVGRLVLPGWMTADPAVVPLLRAARRHGIPVTRVAKGQVLRVGGTVIEVVWPPPRHAPENENERSLVVRVLLAQGAVLLTSDVGGPTELALAHSGSLAGAVLVVPHHGSRRSATAALLDRVSPEIALIPAGPRNRYHHPHDEVLERLDGRGIPYRYPKRDGRCGAEYRNGKWWAYP